MHGAACAPLLLSCGAGIEQRLQLGSRRSAVRCSGERSGIAIATTMIDVE
jgi:hypothetical protein